MLKILEKNNDIINQVVTVRDLYLRSSLLGQKSIPIKRESI